MAGNAYYKAGDSVKADDLNDLLNFARNIQTNSGQVGGGTTEFHIPATNAQSAADLSYCGDNDVKNVKSHSVIYAVPETQENISRVRWYSTRQKKSQAYYTLGNAAISCVGTQVLDKYGQPATENGEPIVSNNEAKQMVAVQAMTFGMKYVLRVDGDEDALSDGEGCYWGGIEGLKSSNDGHAAEFVVSRYEYNYRTPSFDDIADPLLDPRRRISISGIQEYVVDEGSYVGTIDTTGLTPTAVAYTYYVACLVPDTPGQYSYDAVENAFLTRFWNGQRIILYPVTETLSNCYQFSDGYVYNPDTGMKFLGLVPRDNVRIADNISQVAFYQWDIEQAMSKTMSVVGGDKSKGQWTLSSSAKADSSFPNVFFPTEYDTTQPAKGKGYAEVIYQAIQDEDDEDIPASTLAKVILPITKPLLSIVDPRPNALHGEEYKNPDGTNKVPVSFYVAKSMGLIEPYNSTASYAPAVYSVDDFKRTENDEDTESKDEDTESKEDTESGAETNSTDSSADSNDDEKTTEFRGLPFFKYFSNLSKTAGVSDTATKKAVAIQLQGYSVIGGDGDYINTGGVKGVILDTDKKGDVVISDKSEKGWLKNLQLAGICGNYVYGRFIPKFTSESIPICYNLLNPAMFYMQKIEVNTSNKSNSSDSNSITHSTFAKYRSFLGSEKSSANPTDTTTTPINTTAGWIRYKYYDQNREDTDGLVETIKLYAPTLDGYELQNGSSTSSKKSEDTTETKSDSEDTTDDSESTEKQSSSKLVYKPTSQSGKSISFDPLDMTPFRYDEFKADYGTAEIESIEYSGETGNVSAVINLKFTPKINEYDDENSFPFSCSSPPLKRQTITTTQYKAHRSDWIPALCTTLDQNEVLVPGMVVVHETSNVSLIDSNDDDDDSTSSVTTTDFQYSVVVSPESYSSCLDGTPDYIITEFTYKKPTITELEKYEIVEDDIWVSDIEKVTEIPSYNYAGKDYYVGIKLSSTGIPDIRQAFGAFHDCENVGSLTLFVRRSAWGVNYCCTGRLDYIPFGYAVPSRTPSCYYKSANDTCSPNFTSQRYVIKRDEADSRLYLVGACYVPCSSLTSLK